MRIDYNILMMLGLWFRRWDYLESLNNGHGGDEHFVQCSEVVPSLEVEMY